MNENHEALIAILKDHFTQNHSFDAVLVVGSVARGDASTNSDIDLVFVTNDLNLSTQKNIIPDKLEANVGYKFVTTEYLNAVSKKGVEPARFELFNAIPIISKIPTLKNLLEKISDYPENERIDKMESFYSQLPVHLSYIELAEYSQNAYLLSQTSEKMVLFGGRLILAYNRILFPNRKQFISTLTRVDKKPKNIIELGDKLLRNPNINNANAYCCHVMNYKNWPIPQEGCWDRFRRDSEMHWYLNKPPIEDC